ncbi:hypothetical protein [Streptomyces sp. NPDC094437]|uniref:hypothetical protein n=1 Tax=Streptomyces sp. NPDC094437 TaxID=3366060 RepID=UPI003822DDCD
MAHAVALCRGGRRGDGVELLAGASRSAPADRRLTHALAVMAWHALDAVHGDRTPETWRRCVALWAGLLHDARFWEARRVEAAERYATPLGDDVLTALRADVLTRLEARMPEADPSVRPSPDIVLDRETEAARLLAENGGFPPAPGIEPLVCGPLRIVELGREGELGAYVAGAGEAAPELRQAFSHLGYAHALLRLDRPAEALSALSGLRCPSCRARGASDSGSNSLDRRSRSDRNPQDSQNSSDHTDASVGRPAAPVQAQRSRAAVCDVGCPHFDARNPAYSGLPDKERQLVGDGRVVALAARLAQGRAALGAGGVDVRAASVSWQRALTHAQALGRLPEVEGVVAEAALGAAKRLHRAGDVQGAGDTLEVAYALLGEGQHDRIKGQLARVLTDRAIARANHTRDRMESPAADLRRAVELNPHLLRAQLNLAVALHILGAQLRWSGSLSGAIRNWQEAADRLTAALVHFPADPELTELRDLVNHDLALVHSEFEQGRIGGLPE